MLFSPTPFRTSKRLRTKVPSPKNPEENKLLSPQWVQTYQTIGILFEVHMVCLWEINGNHMEIISNLSQSSKVQVRWNPRSWDALGKLSLARNWLHSPPRSCTIQWLSQRTGRPSGCQHATGLDSNTFRVLVTCHPSRNVGYCWIQECLVLFCWYVWDLLRGA